MIDILPLTIYSLTMSVTPGPNNLMLAAAGAVFGFRRTLPHMAGVVAGHGLQTYLMCLGLGALFEPLPLLHLTLKAMGAAYLIYLAWKLVGATALNATTAPTPLSLTQAALFQFINPKAWVMATTTAALFMPSGAMLWSTGALVTLAVVVVVIPCISLWTLFGVAISRVLTNRSRRLTFNAGMALLLAATAVLIAFGA